MEAETRIMESRACVTRFHGTADRIEGRDCRMEASEARLGIDASTTMDDIIKGIRRKYPQRAPRFRD
eukprot:scaffold2553_cov138-Cylindrotheca_fusiformis.AAC.9